MGVDTNIDLAAGENSLETESGSHAGSDAKAQSLWSRSFVLLSIATFLLFSSFYLLLPTMPLSIKALGGLDAHVGLSTGLFTLAAVLARPFAGGFIDSYGRKPFLLWGLGLFIVSMVSYGWMGSVTALNHSSF